MVATPHPFVCLILLICVGEVTCCQGSHSKRGIRDSESWIRDSRSWIRDSGSVTRKVGFVTLTVLLYELPNESCHMMTYTCVLNESCHACQRSDSKKGDP